MGLQAAQGQPVQQNSLAGRMSPAPGAASAPAQGKGVTSIQSLRRAVAQNPADIALRLRLAAAYFHLGDLEHARMEYQTAHETAPGNVEAALGLAYTYVKLGRNEDAVNLLAPLEPGHASNLDLEYMLGYAEIEAGHAAEGTPRMETVARARRSADAYVIAGSGWMYLNKFRLAQADFEAARALNPNLAGLQTLLGQTYFALGNTDAAVPAFQAALRSNPSDFTANLYLGTIRLTDRDFANARPLLELALDLRPDVPLARLEMAKLDGMTGHEAQAVTALEALEKASPNWLDPHVELAALYYRLHRPADGERERAIVEKLQAQQQKSGPQ